MSFRTVEMAQQLSALAASKKDLNSSQNLCSTHNHL